MATVAHEIGRSKAAKPKRGDVLVPVIVDGEVDVRVVLTRFAHPPRLGDRFRLAGQVWEIIREADHLRGCVARPVHPGSCAH